MLEHESGPALVVRAPAMLCGQSFALRTGELRIGRAVDSDVRLDDPHVSRRHALLRRTDGIVMIEDAGSTAGVLINGVRASQPTPLRPGDRVRLGGVELELLDRGPERDAPRAAAPRADGRVVDVPVVDVPVVEVSEVDRSRAAAGRRFELQNQYAGAISNVAGNQYNEHALRIEPMRRAARRVMRTGFWLFLSGLVTAAVGFALYGSTIVDCGQNLNVDNCNGLPHKGVIGVVIFGVGIVLSLIAIIMVITSLFMRRGVRREEKLL